MNNKITDKEEFEARKALVELCHDIANEFEPNEIIEDNDEYNDEDEYQEFDYKIRK